MCTVPVDCIQQPDMMDMDRPFPSSLLRCIPPCWLAGVGIEEERVLVVVASAASSEDVW